MLIRFTIISNNAFHLINDINMPYNEAALKSQDYILYYVSLLDIELCTDIVPERLREIHYIQSGPPVVIEPTFVPRSQYISQFL